MVSDKPICPSCGDGAPTGSDRCGRCGAPIPAREQEGGRAERALQGGRPPPPGGDRGERPEVPVEYEAARAADGKKLLEPDTEIKVDREDMLEKETYMCLICGSIVPALADRCPICGTIFVSETEARTFAGIPVARVARRGAPEPPGAALHEVPRVGEPVNLEQPNPRPLSASALKEADVLPVLEAPDTRRVVVKKRVVRRRPAND